VMPPTGELGPATAPEGDGRRNHGGGDVGPYVRTAVWAHSLASWAAFGVLWVGTLVQPNRPPLDLRFLLIFGLTEGLAPLWLPVSFLVYWPGDPMNRTTLTIVAVYLPVAALTAAWRWRRERRRLLLTRQSEGRCVGCGYDLRATTNRCPECGTVASTLDSA